MSEQLSLLQYPNPESRKTTPLHDLALSGLANMDDAAIAGLLRRCAPNPLCSLPIKMRSDARFFNVSVGLPMAGKLSADAAITFIDFSGHLNAKGEGFYRPVFLLVEIKTEMQSCSATIDQMNRYEFNLTQKGNRYKTKGRAFQFWEQQKENYPDPFWLLLKEDFNEQIEGFILPDYLNHREVSEDVGKIPMHLDPRIRRCVWDADYEYPLPKLLICPHLEDHERSLFTSQGISVFTGLETLLEAGKRTLCQRCINSRCPLHGLTESWVKSCAGFMER